MKNIHLKIASIFLLLNYSHAQEKLKEQSSQAELDIINVWSEPFAQKMGTQAIDSWKIEQLPTGNGTISELLKSNPNVQFSNSSNLSTSQGEIAPENISFHGERFYNNNWMIDGISNSDNTNPAVNNGNISWQPKGSRPQDLPDSGTQSFWLNSDIVDSVVVYDSNISAQYGQFTGGVIDAKLKDANTDKPSGSISYRTTRDSWTKFNINNDNVFTAKFNEAEQLFHQPKFIKNIYQINLNQPINDKAAIMFTYNRTDSKIPYHHSQLDKWENQRRIAENFMLKGIYEANGGNTFKLTAMYSPHKSKYFLSNTVDSAFENQGGGFRINAEWESLFNKGAVKTYLGYRQINNTIEYGADNAYTWKKSPTKNWTSLYFRFPWGAVREDAIEGGYGQWGTEKKVITLKQDIELDTFQLGEVSNKLSLGWKADWSNASYDREKATNIYTAPWYLPLNTSVTCNPGDTSCIPGEQFANQRVEHLAKSVKVNTNHYAAYLQNQMNYKNLEVTPGVRIDYDNFLGNTNIAPRLTGSYDVFGDKKTRIFGGANRYYADSMLSYALREKIGASNRYSRRTSTGPWVLNTRASTAGTSYSNSNLKTPYSDEINLGLVQQIGNSEWVAKWVKRKGKDQFATTTKEVRINPWRTRTEVVGLNNNGWSEADTFTLTGRLLNPVEWNNVTLSLDLGASYTKNKENFSFYENYLNSDDLDKKVIVNNKLKNIDDAPALDYNTPWRAFANVNIAFPKLNLNWSNIINYTAGYKSYATSNYTCTSGDSICNGYVGDAIKYDELKYKQRFTVDWRFAYKVPVATGDFTVNLDILNVLNAKVEGEQQTPTRGGQKVISYKPGRQFWLGAKYEW